MTKNNLGLPLELKDSSFTLSDRVGILTFERNDMRNALTGTALIDDVIRTIDWANACADVSVLVITGGGSAFSAGGNVKEMRDRKGLFSGTVLEIQDQYRRGVQRISLALNRAEIPLIAAVNGPAIGAGLDLACMCDIRLGSTAALLGETFLNLGIIPGDGGAWFLQRLVGYQRAVEMSLTGRLVKADEALDIGLLLEVVEPEKLMPRAIALATRIASQPPLALRLTKRLHKSAQRMELPDFLDVCACFQGMAHHTEDHKEAVDAFVEKRPGNYSGR